MALYTLAIVSLNRGRGPKRCAPTFHQVIFIFKKTSQLITIQYELMPRGQISLLGLGMCGAPQAVFISLNRTDRLGKDVAWP